MKVSYVISGDFVQENGKLNVTAELTRVSDDRLLWRDTLVADPTQLMKLHEDMAERLQSGVVGTLGGKAIKEDIPVPHNPRAYDLYLRSVAVPRDPVPNKAAISALNEALAEDPDYAPAWRELAWRAYLDASYSTGGEKLYQVSADASARAAALDPNGTANSITIRIEHGNVEEGFDEALRLLSRRPDASNAHFEMSYVYRYAGLLDQAAQECNTSLAIDPGDYLFRSCSKVFIYKKDYPRAQLFLNLDGNSGWTVREQMQAALRQQNYEMALAMGIIAIESGYKDSQLVVTRLEHKPAAEMSKVAAKAESDALQQADSEEAYEVAAMLSFAGQTDRSLRVLKNAIHRGYCATPLLDLDPLLSNVSTQPEFQQIRTISASCQQSFLNHMKSAQTRISPSSN
jgi:tetratricopeptide (TPR) repeat protein